MTNAEMLLLVAEQIAETGVRVHQNALYEAFSSARKSFRLIRYIRFPIEQVAELTTSEQILFVLFVRELILTDGEL